MLPSAKSVEAKSVSLRVSAPEMCAGGPGVHLTLNGGSQRTNTRNPPAEESTSSRRLSRNSGLTNSLQPGDSAVWG
jgi:hypothetical protein